MNSIKNEGKESVNPKTVVKEFWASYNRGNLDETWTTYVAEDIIIHPPAGVELDRESWLAMEKALFAAFEDVDVKVLDQVAEDDMVASRWSLTARQTTEFMGVPSRGRTATVTGILFDRVRDDKIAEHWAELSLSHFLQVLSAE
jgi:predicted ester cyclase